MAQRKITLIAMAICLLTGLGLSIIGVVVVRRAMAEPDNVGLVNNCLVIGMGPDEDSDIITVNVTGSPTFRWDESADSFVITHPLEIEGIGDGGLTNYDLIVGGAEYGLANIGKAVIGRTSFNSGNADYDGTVIIQNLGGPVTSQVEFIFTESGGGTARFVLPKSGVGNATLNPRSMFIIGPAPNDDDMVTLAYWQALGWFPNIDCDTAGTGADIGIMDDGEFGGTVFTDSIAESTAGAGVTFTGGLIIPSGTTPGPDVEGAIFLDIDESANGSFMIYSNGSWRKSRDL